MAIGAVFGIVMFFCFFLRFSGQVSFSTKGFAVDSEGQLYVGREGEIAVLKDGERVRTISPRTSRS